MKLFTRKTTYLLLALVMLITAICVSPASQVEAATKEEINYFLDTLGPMCTQDMIDNKILASFSMAQAIYESGWGTSTLAKNANALFGIRAYSTWGGMVYDRNECVCYDSWSDLVAAKGSDYVKEYKNSFWRAYESWAESVADHSDLFNRSSIYESLRGNYDYKSCAYEVVKAGYCTSETYAPYIIKLVEQYDLTKYDYYGDDVSSTPDETPVPDEKPEETVYATSLSLTPKTVYIDKGASFNLSASFAPLRSVLVWSTGDKSVVTVDHGKITAVDEGEAVVSLSSGELKVKCTVKVIEDYGCVVADGVYVACTKDLEVVTIPLEAKKIKSNAFDGMENIKEILIGKSVSEIEVGAFDGIGEGYSLYSLNNSVAPQYASENSIACRSILPVWVLDDDLMTINDIPLGTSASIIKNFYAFENVSAKIYDVNGDLFKAGSANYIGTGCRVLIEDNEYKVIIKGDIIGNGIIGDSDFRLMRKYFANERALGVLTTQAADYNSDGAVNTADYLSMKIAGQAEQAE